MLFRFCFSQNQENVSMQCRFRRGARWYVNVI